jgi:universal stress protein E
MKFNRTKKPLYAAPVHPSRNAQGRHFYHRMPRCEMTHPLRLLFLAPPQAAHSPGLEYAGDLARALGVPLHVAMFTEPHGVEPPGHAVTERPDIVRDNLMSSRRKWLESESAHLQEKGVDVHPELVCASSSAVECVAYAQRVEADLIVKDIQERPGLAQRGLSALDWELLSVSPIAVLYVLPGPIQTPSKFLVAVDMESQAKGNRDNHSLIEAARHLANACGASLHVISVYDCAAASHGDLSLYEAQVQAFDALASQHGIASQHRHFIPGAPANAIHAYLQRSAYNLLVIGAADHHTQASDIGLTAEGILEDPMCSVLMIKLPADAAPQQAKRYG